MTASSARVIPILPAHETADQSANSGGAQGEQPRVVVTMVMAVMRRRGRRVVPMTTAMMMDRRRRMVSAGAVKSAARCRKAGSREGQAGKERSEGFHGLVHITPSLSV